MAYNAKLTVDGKDYKVLSCSYGFRQSTNMSGMPNSEIRISEISVLLESSKDLSLWDWGSDQSGKKDGTITFYLASDHTQEMKKLSFKEGFLTGYSESFGGDTMVTNISITCHELNGGSNPVTNDWAAHQ